MLAGDYLVVLPFNSVENVGRVLKRFRLHADDAIDISGTNKTYLVRMLEKIISFALTLRNSASVGLVALFIPSVEQRNVNSAPRRQFSTIPSSRFLPLAPVVDFALLAGLKR